MYFGVYDGTSKNQDVAAVQNEKKLPQPALQFGQFNLTNIAKKDEIHFFTVSSSTNWTLDFFGLEEIGKDSFLDIDPD